MKTLLAFVCTLLTNGIYSQQIGIDSSYGTNGVAAIPQARINPLIAWVSAMAQQPDGKIVVGGIAQLGENQIAVARYNVDGSADNTFGYQGLTLSTFVPNCAINHLALQSDGKIVAAGNARYLLNDSTYLSQMLVARYTTNGKADSSFGVNGFKLIDLGDSTDDMLTAVDLQADGKIIVAGFSEMLSSFQNVVLRINTNGKIDSTFGVNGLANVPVMGLTKMELQSDDKIVVAGIMIPNTALVRLNANGTTDSSFGTNGLAQQCISTTRDECLALALQADGKILVGGRSFKADAQSRTSFTLARLNTNGTPDSTFSNSGLLTHTVGGTNLGRRHDEILAIAQQPDGKIVVAGKTIINGLNEDAMVLARFTSNGLIDPAFNDSGEVIVNLTGSAERAFDMKLLPNSKIAVLLAPEFHYDNYNYAVVMFEPKLPLGLPANKGTGLRATVFPNPAQATTTLQFELKEEAILSASVLDMQGRQVASLFTNKLHLAGKHNYSLEKLLPSGGMYIVQLQDKNNMQQVTLVKQ